MNFGLPILIFSLIFYSTSHSPLANNDALSPSPAVPEPHVRPSSHLGHALGHQYRHRHHQSLANPLLATRANPSTPPHNGPPLDHSTQQHSHSQTTYVPPHNSSLGTFGAPTPTQFPPSPIQSHSQSPATATVLRNRSTSMIHNNVQNGHPLLASRITRKPSASSTNLDHSPTRSMSYHHPRSRLRAPYLTDWTTAESPDVSSRITALYSKRESIDHSFAGRVHAKPDPPHGVITESLLYRFHASHASNRTDVRPAMHSAVIQHQSCQRCLSEHSRLRVLL